MQTKQDDREHYWRERITTWKSSGLSRKRFCETAKLSYWSFSRWLKKIESESGKTLIRIPEGKRQRETEEYPPIVLILNRGIAIHVRKGFDGGLLRDILRELEARS